MKFSALTIKRVSRVQESLSPFYHALNRNFRFIWFGHGFHRAIHGICPQQ